MSWLLDAVILAIIAFAVISGWKRGFIKTAVNAASGIISIIVAFVFCFPASYALEWTELPESLRIAVAFAALYFISKLVLYFSSELLTKLFDIPVLRTVNKGLGVVLSVLISILNVIALCFIANAVFDAAILLDSDVFAAIDRDSTILFKFFSNFDIFSYILVK